MRDFADDHYSERLTKMARRSTDRGQRNGMTPRTIIGVILLLIAVVGYYWLNNSSVAPTPATTDPTARSASHSSTLPTGVAPNAQGGSDTAQIRIFFTTPSLVYPDRPAERTIKPYEQAIIDDIDAAKKRVDVAVYEYNLESVGAALLRAKKRGVTVRLALDRENLDDEAMAAWAGKMEQAKIPITWEASDAFMHSKFIVIDGTIVWTGSWNATNNDTYRNNNNLLRITAPLLVANYQTEFAQFAKSLFGTKKQQLTPNPKVKVGSIPLENYFLPKDGAEERIVARLKAAKQSIRFLAFSYTSDAIGQAMIDARKAGLTVAGVFESRNANGTGSEYAALRSNDVDVHEDGNCYTMHHKVIIIDERTVITGSYNFTRRAEETNDENLLIIDDAQIAQLYLEEFMRVYQQALQPTRCG